MTTEIIVSDRETARWEDDVLAPIRSAIAAARDIVRLPFDWDGEGSAGYEEHTLERASDFLRASSLAFLARQPEAVLPAPRIGPGPKGSIDVLWRQGTREVLINFPADRAAHPAYYGNDDQHNTVEGTLDLAPEHSWLVYWLVR